MIRKRGSVYYTDFDLPDGKRVRRSTGTDDEVKATVFAVNLHAELTRDGAVQPDRPTKPSSTMTLESALNLVFEERWRE